MSERVIRQVSVIEKSDGSAAIERVDGHLDEVTATGTVLAIPAEDRAAVALALLGGITDELVERGCDAAVEAIRDSAIDWPTYHEAFEPIVRAVLAASGGGGEEANRRG